MTTEFAERGLGVRVGLEPEFIKLVNDYHGSDPDTAFVAGAWDTIMMPAQAMPSARSEWR